MFQTWWSLISHNDDIGRYNIMIKIHRQICIYIVKWFRDVRRKSFLQVVKLTQISIHTYCRSMHYRRTYTRNALCRWHVHMHTYVHLFIIFRSYKISVDAPICAQSTRWRMQKKVAETVERKKKARTSSPYKVAYLHSYSLISIYYNGNACHRCGNVAIDTMAVPQLLRRR